MDGVGGLYVYSYVTGDVVLYSTSDGGELAHIVPGFAPVVSMAVGPDGGLWMESETASMPNLHFSISGPAAISCGFTGGGGQLAADESGAYAPGGYVPDLWQIYDCPNGPHTTVGPGALQGLARTGTGKWYATLDWYAMGVSNALVGPVGSPSELRDDAGPMLTVPDVTTLGALAVHESLVGDVFYVLFAANNGLLEGLGDGPNGLLRGWGDGGTALFVDAGNDSLESVAYDPATNCVFLTDATSGNLVGYPAGEP